MGTGNDPMNKTTSGGRKRFTLLPFQPDGFRNMIPERKQSVTTLFNAWQMTWIYMKLLILRVHT